MWIERITTCGVGPFREERTFRLTPGYTVIHGGNETGKTSLASAVYATFFGIPAGSERRFDPEEAWTEVVFHVGARTFTARRHHTRDVMELREQVGEREETLFSGPLTGKDAGRAYRSELIAILGAGADEVWARSGFLESGELPPRIDEVVRTWLQVHPHRSFDGVLEEMTEEAHRLRESTVSGNGTGTGSDEALEAGYRKLKIWREDAIRLENALGRMRDMEQEYQAAEQALLTAEDLKRALDRFEDLTRERDRLETSLVELRDERDRIRKHIEVQEQAKARLQHDFADFLNGPSEIEEAIQFWIDSSHRLQSVDRDLDRIQSTIAALPPLRTGRNGTIAAVVLGTLSWLICQGSGAAQMGLFLFPVFSAAGFGLVWYLDRNAERVRLSHEKERERILREVEAAREVYQEAKVDLGSLASYDTPADLRAKYRGYMELQEKLDRTRELASAHRPLGEVIDDYEEVFSELQVLDTQTRDLVAQARYLSGLDASATKLHLKKDEATAAMRAAQADTERLNREILELKPVISALEESLEEPGILAEDVRMLEARHAGPRLRQASVELALAGLTEALRRYADNHLERIAARASSIFSRLSGGRYDAVRFTGTLEPEARADAEWHPATELNKVAKEQLLFSVLLAVHSEAGEAEGLPLTLDEPFQGWDDARLQEGRAALDDLVAGGHQVILLSADSRLAAGTETVLHLGPDAVGETGLQAA